MAIVVACSILGIGTVGPSLPGCGIGFFSARAERLCFSGDCPCFDEPYRSKCFAEREAAEAERKRKEAAEQIANDPQTIVHRYRSGSNMMAQRGYGSASIGLTYRFISCFGEIHIAYSLDPKTLTYSDTYYITVDGKKRMIKPAPPAAMPETIPIDFDVRYNGIVTVATIRDKIAGRALGMGCFTGDTRRLGFVKDLIGPKATNAQIKEYLGKLHIGRAETELPFALVGTRTPVVTNDERVRQAAADNAKVNATNADALTAARAQSAAIDAQIAAGKKAQADFDAAVKLNQQRTDAINAENARKQREFAARNATYQACIAGDKAACARYQLGQ